MIETDRRRNASVSNGQGSDSQGGSTCVESMRGHSRVFYVQVSNDRPEGDRQWLLGQWFRLRLSLGVAGDGMDLRPSQLTLVPGGSFIIAT